MLGDLSAIFAGLNIYHVFGHRHGHGHGHGASVWIFLEGVASCRLDTMCISIRTIDLQKGVLKCGVITWIFEF